MLEVVGMETCLFQIATTSRIASEVFVIKESGPHRFPCADGSLKQSGIFVPRHRRRGDAEGNSLQTKRTQNHLTSPSTNRTIGALLASSFTVTMLQLYVPRAL